jgi:hypothetical protein
LPFRVAKPSSSRYQTKGCGKPAVRIVFLRFSPDLDLYDWLDLSSFYPYLVVYPYRLVYPYFMVYPYLMA